MAQTRVVADLLTDYRPADLLITDPLTTELSGQLDKLVVQFKETAPDFYNNYMAARFIVGRAGGRSGTEVKVVAATATGTSSKAA